MSVPYKVTFNQIGVVSPGGNQSIYVTSATPANATFSQVYPGGSSHVNIIGETATVLVNGTGRYTGYNYSGTITCVENPYQTLDEVIVSGNHQTSQSVAFNNVVTISSNLTIGSNLSILDTASNVLSVTGNIAATRFIGDGSHLLNISSNLQQITSGTGNVTTNDLYLANVTANNFLATCPTGLLDLKLLVGPPPPLIFDPVVLNDGTRITVQWTVPPQIQTGFLNEPLPLFSNLTMQIGDWNHSTFSSSFLPIMEHISVSSLPWNVASAYL